MASKKTPEGYVLAAVLERLEWYKNSGKNILYWRQNNGATYDPKRGAYRAVKGLGREKGVPDVMAVYNGVIIGLEVKGPDGILSVEQKAWGMRLMACGGIYEIARDIFAVDRVIARIEKSP